MFVQKNFTVREVAQGTGGHAIWLAAWATLVALVYDLTGWEWMTVPWLPLSVIGIAVAFYLGFKNSSAYDRLWEARKIWGGIVNSSRAWGSTVRAFTTTQFATPEVADEELAAIQRRLIYRHIAWLYALRRQLLIPTTWEHVVQRGRIGRLNRWRSAQLGAGLFHEDHIETGLARVLPDDELRALDEYENAATHVIDWQAQELARLHRAGLVDDFKHVALQEILNRLYDWQGKCERIKKFPLPRQYANASLIFVWIFVFLLPLGLVSEFVQLGNHGVWLSVPFTVLVGWVFVVMELVGDYSENPFEGLANDVPMLSICRAIEIDLRQMIGERDLPPTIKPIRGVLM